MCVEILHVNNVKLEINSMVKGNLNAARYIEDKHRDQALRGCRR